MTHVPSLKEWTAEIGERENSRSRGTERFARWVERNTGLLFLLPATAVLALLILFPLGYTLYFSLHDWFAASQVAPRFIGLQNYIDAAHDPLFWWSVLRMFLYTAVSVAVELFLGVSMALVFNRAFVFRGVARTIFLLPMVATPVAIGLVWLMMFDPVSGIFNYLLSLVGLPPSVWVGDPSIALLSLTLVDIWQWTPLVMLMVLGGLATLPTDPIEAATIDGASALQRIRYVVLPMLRPYIVVAALFRTIDALKSFDTIYVITRGGPAHATETLNLYIYNQAFEYQHIGYSSALVVIFFVIVLAISFGLIAFRRGKEEQ
jgi:multiple sugar transport system permease protein